MLSAKVRPMYSFVATVMVVVSIMTYAVVVENGSAFVVAFVPTSFVVATERKLVQTAVDVVQTAVGVVQTAVGVVQAAVGVVQIAVGVVQTAVGVDMTVMK